MQSYNIPDYIIEQYNNMITCRGQYVFLIGDYGLELFETEKVKNLDIHPISQRKLIPEEITYINFHYDCYIHTQYFPITLDTLSGFYHWYITNRIRGVPVSELYKLSRDICLAVKYYMMASDLQSHFRNFDPSNSEQERYERDLAEEALRNSAVKGKWLLRHSSLNRPIIKETEIQLKIFGVRYYAISYIDNDYKIKHLLLEYRIGKGWKSKNMWFPSFIDCLEYALESYGLVFGNRISAYFLQR